jgi:high-affinity iron transporter
LGYLLYWLVVIVGFLVLGFKERNDRYPFQKAKTVPTGDSESESSGGMVGKEDVAGAPRMEVREIET